MRKSLPIVYLVYVLIFAVSAIAADKVVVIPLNTCSDGLTKCSSQCVDTMNNPNFCGDCTTDCGAGNYCKNGVCNKLNGNDCISNDECISGYCNVDICTDVKTVFVSSARYTGDLGGLAGADEKCQILASAAGLTGDYKAWISDRTGSPSSRFYKYNMPYTLPTNIKIADNWTDLTDGTLDAPINYDEMGTEVATIYVWTRTLTSGDLNPLAGDCNNWSSVLASDKGRVGYAYISNSAWTQPAHIWSCSEEMMLYCFEQ